MMDVSLYNSIMNVVFHESEIYEHKSDINRNIVVIDEDGNEYARISMDKFMQESVSLFDAIKSTGAERAFEIPDTECFMHQIGCERLKAPSRDKSDIQIVIHDLRTNMTPQLGFSIKSQLGSASTLLNPGVPTNITYKVIGGNLTDKEIDGINAIPDHLPRVQALINKGCGLQYADVEHATFKNNLLFIDTCMPQFIADCLICDSMPNATSTIKEAVEVVAKQNPFNYKGTNVLAFYEHKMKVLLLDVALGMTPATEWTGRYDANGGYLVVKKDGDIVCYHFYNRNDVEDYLYNNTRFERASRGRYHFGNLYRGDDGAVFMKLNLQIRFKK